MASDAERVVSIIFNGVDNVSSVAGDVTGTLGKIGDVVEGIAHPFAVLGENVLKTEAALAALAAGGLLYALNRSIDFQSASIELLKVLGDESDRLGEAQQKALELSDAYGVSSTAILGAMANFKQAGFDLDGAMTLAANSLDLVIAGDLEAAEASEILVAALKGFKAPAGDATRLTDILNEVSNNYATNVRELGVGMAAISPIARTMGFSMEETAGLVTPIIEVFRSGDEAATALKTGLLKLVDDSKPVREALSSIGVSQTDANGALRSGKDILFDVATAFQGLEQNQKLYVTQQLVGIHQAGRMVEIFDALSKTTEITATAMGAAGSAAEEVKKRLESAEVAVDRFKTGFENLGIAIGNEFLMAAQEAIEGGTDIEHALQQVVKDGTFAPIFDRLRAFGVDIGDYLHAIAEAIPEAFEQVDFDRLMESLGNLGGSFKSIYDAIFGDLDLTKPEDLAQAIQKVVDTITTLTNVTSGIVEQVSPLVEMFVNMTEKTNKWDAETQKAAGNRLADAMIIDKFGAAAGGAMVFLAGLGNAAETTDEAISELNILGDPFSAMTYGAQDATEAIEEVPSAFGDIHAAIADMPPLEIVDPAKTETDMGELWEVVKGACDDINAGLKASGGAQVPAKVDEASLVVVKQTLEEKLPKTHELDVKIKQELIRAQTEITTATIRSETEKWKSMFESVNVGIESTGDTLQSFWDTLAGGDLSLSQRMDLESYIEEENDRRREEFDLQKRLTEQQIALNQLKVEALERGDALISIEGSGLQPHLEAFMWEILEAIQIRANATGAEFLLGV
ncbi:MAG: phage tail tape measure protein [Deltaproteobacteria bacterium]|nr:phage tail tape measure protein [Deltaproteobacteria bacterium]